jgi:pimeloyl-ACP methyl ester carboxylesterase
MESRFVDYQGGEIYYTVSGTGETVILVHGYLESSDVWGRFRDALSARYRVLSVDLPGNGRSSIYSHKHTMCFHAGAVLAVLDEEQIASTFLIGHSLGGYAALSLVEKNPERLKGYVLLHSHPYADTEDIIENRLREIRIVKAGKQDAIYPVNIPKMFADTNLEKCSEDVNKLVAIASDHKAEGIIAVLKGMIQRKSRDDIMANSSIPLLYILGKMDNYIPYDKIVSNIVMPPTGRILTLENSGHMGFLEETNICIEAVSEFISQSI